MDSTKPKTKTKKYRFNFWNEIDKIKNDSEDTKHIDSFFHATATRLDDQPMLLQSFANTTYAILSVRDAPEYQIISYHITVISKHFT